MREVCVVKSAVVSGLGPDLESLWRGLVAGESAVREIRRFDAGHYLTPNASWVEGLEGHGAPSLILPLLDLLREGFGPVPADAVLITASTKGCIDALDAGDADLLSGAALPRLVAERFQSQGDSPLRQGGCPPLYCPPVNVNAACASSTLALARAASLIAAGLSEAVLVVCADLVSEFVLSGFSALQALAPERCRPFDRNRNGLSLGEGGAALLLMSRERARREERPVLGTLAGWGAANDATHITAPARDACGLILALRQALHRAGIAPDQVAAVNAHGTGTVYNDQMELTAFAAVFGERSLPVHSVKGAIGHTLGAAGGIEAALGLKCLGERLIPPTVGLEEPEAGGEHLVSASSRAIDGEYLVSTNSGFGGVNAALVLRREVA